MHPLRLGPLHARVVTTPNPNSNARDSAHGEEGAPCVVLLHGFGAPGADLVGLAHELKAPPGTRFVFPEAPHVIDVGQPSPHPARAWWMIDMARLQVAVMTHQLDALAENHPEGLDEARGILDEFLTAVRGQLGVDGTRLVVGGFSQGAMLSCDWLLRGKRDVAGLVLLSGTTICQSEWLPLLNQRPRVPVFQSHGAEDPILPLALARRLHEAFLAQDWNARFVQFPGGHGVGRAALMGLETFLTTTLARA